MGDTRDDPFDHLPPELQQEVVAACDRFEAALRAGEPVRAEQFLGPPGPAGKALLRELLVTELEYRFRGAVPAAPVVEEARRAAGGGPGGGLRLPGGGPAVVGPYRLVRELGSGGFGAVFLAADTRSGREVALKVPHPRALLGLPFRDRLLREAAAAARLDHPHVVRVLDAGEDGPFCYLASEYVPGPTLSGWLRDRGGEPVPARQAAGLLLPVAEAVAHAHARGVLHLDLTPGNVLLAGDPAAPDPMVTDFGLARVAGEPSAASAAGLLAGTPEYLAPELAAGRRPEADRRADVYGLGAILYELLTGRPPAVAESSLTALALAARGYPDRPRRFRPAVPPDLEAVCLRCLEREPARRYAAADEVAADLRRFLAGRQTAARPPGPAARLRWWFRRDPAAARVRLVVCGAGLVLAGVLVYHAVAVEAANRDLAGANANLTAARAQAEARAADLRRRGYADAVRRAAALLDVHDAAGCRRALDEYRPRPGEDDLRGFEWHLIDRLAEPAPHRLVAAFPGAVTAVAYAPDGRLAAAGGAGGVIRLFDPADGREPYPPLSHPAAVEYLAFAPDGRRLATACADGVVRLWAVGADYPAAECRGHAGRAQCVAWSPDGRRLVSGGRDGTVRVWEPGTGDGRILDRLGSVRAVAWAPDGRAVLAAADPAPALPPPSPHRLLDPETGEVLGSLNHDSTVVAAGFLPGGRAVTAGRDGTVRVWEPGSGPDWREVARAATARPRINDLAVSRDRAAVAACLEGAVEVWRPDPPVRAAVLRHPGGVRVWAAAFSPDGGELLTAGADGAVRAYDLTSGGAVVRVAGSYSADCLAVRPAEAGVVVAAGGRAGGRAWRVGAGGRPEEVARDGRYMPGVWIDPAGGLWAIGEGGGLRKWGDPTTDTRGRVDGGWAMGLLPTQVAADPEGGLVAVSDDAAVVRVRAVTGGPAREVRPGPRVADLAFGPGGRLAAACLDRTVRVWDARTMTEVARLDCGAEWADLVAVGPGGLTAAGCQAALLVWEAGDTAPRHRLLGHRGRVTALDVCPDGRTLASGGADGVVRLWRVDTGFEAAALTGFPGPVSAVRFSPDGQFLVAAAPGGPGGAADVVVYDAGAGLSPR